MTLTGYSEISLFETIEEKFKHRLATLDCTKALLVHLSHALENIVLREQMPAVLLTGFQESKHWRQESERYIQLSNVAHQLCIFSGGAVPPSPSEKHLHIKLLGDDPLRQEWFLCILTEKFSVVLCGQDQGAPVREEPLRRFSTLWSFEPDIIDEVMTLLEQVVGFYLPENLGQLRDSRRRFPAVQPDARLLTEFTRDMLRFQEELYASAQQEIVERRQIEQQLIQSQKMEVVGRLAGGIAHDFNNLLTAILGFAGLTLRNLSPNEKPYGYVQQIIKSGDQAASLTAQLLAFSRKQIVQPEVLELNDMVDDASRMLSRLIGEHIELITRLSSDLWQIEADPSRLQQVIVNVVVNARDAMPSGGTLTITTRNRLLDEGYAAQFDGVAPGHYVQLSISDTGYGMDPETLSRIFDPFFTTKGPEQGTGLGLSMVYGTVKQSGGHITAYSEPGRGTVIHTYWPAITDQRAEIRKPAKQEPLPNGTGTILVVEDEPAVRDFISGVLTDLGYRVMTAGDGREAQRLIKTVEAPIHLLLTDVVMPYANGPQVAAMITRHHPEIKVIFMSGYTDDIIGDHGILPANVHFLQKPFSAAQLGREIKATLAG